MIDPSWYLLGLLLPMVIAAAGVWFLARGQGDTGGRLAPIGWALGIGLGSAAGLLALTGMPPWKPIQGYHWILMAVLPASMAVGLIGSIPKTPRPIVWALRAIVAGATAPLLTYSLVPHTWSQNEAYAWWAGMGAWIFVFWILMHALVERGRGRLVIFALGATAGAIGGATMASGYLVGGQFVASLAAALGGGWLATLGRGTGATVGRGVVDVTVAPMFGLLIFGWQYGWTMEHDVSPYIVAGLLAVAPLGVWAQALPGIPGRSSKQRTAASLIIVGFLIVTGLGLAGYEASLRLQPSTTGYPY